MITEVLHHPSEMTHLWPAKSVLRPPNLCKTWNSLDLCLDPKFGLSCGGGWSRIEVTQVLSRNLHGFALQEPGKNTTYSLRYGGDLPIGKIENHLIRNGPG